MSDPIAPAEGNLFGWDLPYTDRLLNDESPYVPLADPAQNLAERLTFLGHLGFNTKMWGPNSGRLDTYWGAFQERLESSANQIIVAEWWDAFVRDMGCAPLSRTTQLHEKNLLTRPTQLVGTPVDDGDVLAVFRKQSHDLRDRCQMWVRTRRAIWRAANPDRDDEQD